MEQSAGGMSADGELHRVRDEFVNRVSIGVINQLLDKLYKDHIIDSEDMEMIYEENPTRTKKARALIDLVRRKGPEACQMLIAFLESKDRMLFQTLALPSAQLFQSDEVKSSQDLSDKQLLQVAKCLGSEWRQAAIYLELQSKDLDELEESERSLPMRKLKMLLKWKTRCKPGEATARHLLESLKGMEEMPYELLELVTGMMDKEN